MNHPSSAIGQSCGVPNTTAIVNLAYIQRERGDYERALSGFRRQLELDRASGKSDSPAVALKNIGQTLMLIDLDHFKEINDRYGHDTGDQVLVVFARALERCGDENDLLVCWGGEEFMWWLVDKGLNDAVVACRPRPTCDDSSDRFMAIAAGRFAGN